METVTKTLNYTDISNEIQMWLKNYANKAKAKGFTLGVSGGIDSAVVSTLVVKTGLPVLILEMPIHQGTAEVDRAKNHITWLKENYSNVESHEIDLTEAYDVFYEKMNFVPPFFGELIDKNKFDFSMANTRSRLRMTTLYQFAGMHKLLVAGTGNKVEDFGIGFYTKYGDGGVDISPIADLMKSEVYALGAELGLHKDILTAAPTDGLHTDGRTDEEQLKCTYSELEWAMNLIQVTKNTFPSSSLEEESKVIKSLVEQHSGRDAEVLKIYLQRYQANLHKMTPIPIFDVSNFRK